MGRLQRVYSGDVALQVRTWGQREQTPIVLVHGYPDNHQVWQLVAPKLAERFYVIAYDVRGAGGSDVPTRLVDYRMAQLSADLLAVVDTLIPERRFHLAGHDWGSIQSWESVTTEPLKSRILSYTTISGPCLDHIGVWMRDRVGHRSWPQRRKALRQMMSSWYIFFFQLPLLPELSWQLGVGKRWPSYLQKHEGISEPQANPTQVKDGQYGVRLYRANFLPKLLRPEQRYATAPVQLIVPTGDKYVGTQLFEDLHRWVPELYRRDLDANHWVSLSHPQLIADWIGDFAAAVDSGKQQQELVALRVDGSTSGAAA